MKTDEELMDHIYSGPCLCPGLQLKRLGYCFRGLIITHPILHFRGQDTTSGDLSLTATHDITSGDLSLRASHNTSEIRLLLPRTYHYVSTRHFRDNHHYRYDIIPASISFPRPSVSREIYYILSSGNVHTVFIAIQYQ